MLTKTEISKPAPVAENDLAPETSPKSQAAGLLSVVWTVMRGFIQILLMGAILVGAFLVANRMIASAPEVPKRPPFKTVYTVDSIIAEAGNHQPTITVYGEVVASRNVELRSLVSGEVTAINPKLKAGEIVQEGDPLVEIDRFNYEGALREAQANLAETEARIAEGRARIAIEQSKIERTREQMELARNDLDRIQSLRERGTATEKQLEDRKFVFSQRMQALDQTEINLVAEQARLEQQEAALERNRWKVDQAKRNLEDTVLTAPFTGIIRSTSVEVGKVASANDMLVAMYEADKLDVRFTLTDARFGRVRSDDDGIIGRPVTVYWSVGGDEQVFTGEISRLGAEIASNRGGIEVFATLTDDNAARTMRPGAFVEISVPDRLYRDHIRVPETALYGGDRIYVVENGELVPRDVKVSGYDGEYALIGGGLSVGEEVLTTRIAEISPGLAVRTPFSPEEGSSGGRPATGETGTPAGKDAQ